MSDWSDCEEDILLDSISCDARSRNIKRARSVKYEMGSTTNPSQANGHQINFNSNNFSNPIYDNHHQKASNSHHDSKSDLNHEQTSRFEQHHDVLTGRSQYSESRLPTSRTTIILSFTVVLLIVFVTIIPLFFTPLDPKGENNSTIEHRDVRCKCICPPLPDEKDKNKKDQKRFYVDLTTLDECNCNHVVVPNITIPAKLVDEFCVKCECKYQSRNTTTIRRVVYFFLTVLSGFCAYMAFNLSLKYLKFNLR